MRVASTIIFAALLFVFIVAVVNNIVYEYATATHATVSVDLDKYQTYKEVNELRADLPSMQTDVTQADTNTVTVVGDIMTVNWTSALRTGLKLLGKTPSIATAMFTDAINIAHLPVDGRGIILGILSAVVVYLVIRAVLDRVIGKI